MTIQQIRKREYATWVECSSPTQGQQLGKYYYKDNKEHVWENFDFNNYSPFYCYIACKGESMGGWNGDTSCIKETELLIKFSDIEWEEAYTSKLNYQIY